MLRYRPPKSSIWGHKLRKMEPQRQKQLLDQFLQLATAENAFNNGTVFFPKVRSSGGPLPAAFSDVNALFEREFSQDARKTRDGLFGINEVEFNFCFYQLLQAGALDPAHPCSAHVSGLIVISKWSLNRREIPTKSTLISHYGPLPAVSTMFQFETIDDFHGVQKILSDLGLCQLSEKHLKTTKRLKRLP
jgi:hypothetical protein